MKAGFTAAKVSTTKLLNSRTLWIELDRSIDAQPGQFVMAWLPEVGERPFSIASLDPLSLMVVDVGPCSHAMHQLNPGDLLWIKGPLGQGFNLIGEKLVFVGGGYGAAPLWALARKARFENKAVQICLGAGTADDVLLSDAFLDIGCEVFVTTEDGSLGERGLVTEVVERILSKSGGEGLYACGPIGMLSAMAALAKTREIPYQLSWEAHMRCGMGLCGSCEVSQSFDPNLPPGWLACYDGPVFRYP